MPVSCTCVRETSWSAPKFITLLSAKNKSLNSSDVVPNAAPSDVPGTNADVAVIVVPCTVLDPVKKKYLNLYRYRLQEQ